MMKTINVTFEESEYIELLKIKESQSWHDFIMSMIKEEGDADAKVRISKDD